VVHEVAAADDADQLAALDDRQPSKLVQREQLRGAGQRLVGSDELHVLRHVLRDKRVLDVRFKHHVDQRQLRNDATSAIGGDDGRAADVVFREVVPLRPGSSQDGRP
jgi:hypothetical protein